MGEEGALERDCGCTCSGLAPASSFKKAISRLADQFSRVAVKGREASTDFPQAATPSPSQPRKAFAGRGGDTMASEDDYYDVPSSQMAFEVSRFEKSKRTK